MCSVDKPFLYVSVAFFSGIVAGYFYCSQTSCVGPQNRELLHNEGAAGSQKATSSTQTEAQLTDYVVVEYV